MEEPLICPLCLHFDSEHLGDYFCAAKCGHLFHRDCIQKIFQRNVYTCPMNCEQPIVPEELTKLFGLDVNSRYIRRSSLEKSAWIEEKTLSNYYSTPLLQVPAPPLRPEFAFKIVILGDAGVGKTSLIRRFSDMEYSDNVTTTPCVDLVRKMFNIGGSLTQLIIWDTAGQENFRAIIPACVRDVHGVVFMYDITDVSTFESISSWIEFAQANAPDDIVRLIVGNKSDKEESRAVDKRCAKTMGDLLKMPFLETSAKDDVNVSCVFRTITAKIIENEWLMGNKKAWKQIRLNSISLHDESCTRPGAEDGCKWNKKIC